MKQYCITFVSDAYNRMRFNPATGEYGSYEHEGGNASTLKSARSVIRNLRKLCADDNPREFKVFDTLADVDPVTNFVPCVYMED